MTTSDSGSNILINLETVIVKAGSYHLQNYKDMLESQKGKGHLLIG